jgi:hypothetical protein
MSVVFNTTTNNTNLINTAYTGPATQIITIMAWILAPVIGTPANYRDIIAVDPNIYMQLFSDGTSVDYGTQTIDHVGPALLANNWYHVCQVVVPTSTTNRQIYGYLNGQLVVNVNDTSTFSTYTNVCIGNSIFSGEAFPFSGSIRDVRVWQRQLTPTEIADEMNSKVSFHKEGLLFWAPFDDNARLDWSGNNTTFTVGSAVTIGPGRIHAYRSRRFNYIR